MLNSKALSDLLSKNVHPTISPRWFVMTPNATLLAYSTPNAVKETRDQAALLSMIWKDHTSRQTSLETLTIEFPDGNIIIRAVQPQLLLVLVGSTWKPREGEQALFKITPEGSGGQDEVSGEVGGDARKAQTGRVRTESAKPNAERHGMDDRDASNSSASSKSEDDEALRLALLAAQRAKMDAATEHLRGDFQMKGFVMPDEGGGGEM